MPTPGKATQPIPIPGEYYVKQRKWDRYQKPTPVVIASIKIALGCGDLMIPDLDLFRHLMYYAREGRTYVKVPYSERAMDNLRHLKIPHIKDKDIILVQPTEEQKAKLDPLINGRLKLRLNQKIAARMGYAIKRGKWVPNGALLPPPQ